MAQMQSIFERNQEATIYVGNLEQKVTEDVLWELFLQCGPVVNIHMPRDKINNEHQNYGFIEFRSEEDADYAIKIMHMIKLYGKPIKVNKASQDKRMQEVGANLFISNLDQEVDEKMLFNTFSAFGIILSTKIIRDTENSQSKGHGFISFDNFESSDSALNAMNGLFDLHKKKNYLQKNKNEKGQYFCNKQLHISYAYKKDTKGERHGSAAERLLAANRPVVSQKQQQIPMYNMPTVEQLLPNQHTLHMPQSLLQPNQQMMQKLGSGPGQFAKPHHHQPQHFHSMNMNQMQNQQQQFQPSPPQQIPQQFQQQNQQLKQQFNMPIPMNMPPIPNLIKPTQNLPPNLPPLPQLQQQLK